jgi:hypothetical protein
MLEKNIQDAVWKESCRHGFTLFRNNVGLFAPAFTIDAIRAAILRNDIPAALNLCKTARKIRCGLTPGSGDLIGWNTVDGIAQFASIEVKTDSGVLRPDQSNWDEQVRKAGGISIIARSTADLDV